MSLEIVSTGPGLPPKVKVIVRRVCLETGVVVSAPFTLDTKRPLPLKGISRLAFMQDGYRFGDIAFFDAETGEVLDVPFSWQ